MEETGQTRSHPLIRIIAGAVLVVPALAWWLGFSERFRAPKLLAGEGLALLGVLAVAWLPSRALRTPVRWADYSFDLVVVAAIASQLTNSTHPLTGWEDVLRLAGLSAAFSLFRGMDRPRDLLPVVVVAAALNAGLALLQAAGLGLWETTRTGRHAIYGTFGNPNLLAEWLVVALPLLVAAYPEGSAKRLRTAAVVIAIAAVVACGSRAAAIALAAASPILAIGLGDRGRGRVLAVVGVAALIVVGVAVGREWRPTAAGEAVPDPTRETRTLMRRVATIQWRERIWLGAGPGAYGLGFLDGMAQATADRPAPAHYPGITAEAHCDPLQTLAERGLLGAVAWMLALGWGAGLAGSRSARDGAESRRFLAMMASLVAMGILAFVAFPFHVFPAAALFLWIVAVVADEFGGRGAGDEPGAKLYGWIRAVMGIAGLLLAGRLALAQAALGDGRGPALRTGVTALPTHGELRFRIGLGLVRADRLAEAEEQFLAALPGYPDPDVRFNLGWIALQRKDYAVAIDRFSEGLRRYPFFRAPAWADYALALEGAGRIAEAGVAAERALAIDPALGRARVLLDRLRRTGRTSR